MLKLLIVEDNVRKLQKIVTALLEIEGFDLNNVTHVIDLNNAKKELKETYFDILILDIALPSRIDQEVKPDTGILLLDELTQREGYKLPAHIIGITGIAEVYRTSLDRFSRALFTIIHYDETSTSWSEGLQSKVKHIVLSKADQTNEARHIQSFICIVCALESPELESILQIDWQWTQQYVPGDETVYHRAVLDHTDKKKIIYAAAAARMGMTASAILSMKMISAFRPEYLVMSGITAGIPGKTKLGDIIIADPSWDWGSGKWENRDGELMFSPAPHQLPLAVSLRNRFQSMRSNARIFFDIRQNWKADKPDHELSMHIGPLASGASVLADGSFAELIKSQHRNLLGVEMETYAVFAAAEEATTPRPQALSIKSVVDFANGNKNDQFQKYAAYTSAQTLKHFIERYI